MRSFGLEPPPSQECCAPALSQARVRARSFQCFPGLGVSRRPPALGTAAMAGFRTMSQSQQVALSAGVAAAVAAGVGYTVWRARRTSAPEVPHPADRAAGSSRAPVSVGDRGIQVRVLFGSTTGTSEKCARQLAGEITEEVGRRLGGCGPVCGCKPQIEVTAEDLATFLFDSLLVAPESGAPWQVVVVLLSTHMEGAPPPHCAHFCTLLEDHVQDFRVGKTALAHLSFAIAGFGSTEYQAAGHYCTAAARVDRAFAALSGTRLLPLLRVTDTQDASSQMQQWSGALFSLLAQLAGGVRPADAAAARQGRDTTAVDEDQAYDSDDSSTTVGSGGGVAVAEDQGDLEDVADSCAGQVGAAAPREMLTAKHRAQLTKEGYKLIGSHSAVKLCRWTKHQLRGRGGCYKHSFYGITSYQCMEATPSLACANKCVFCWRHHKNPVGTSWKWRMDPPEAIVAQGVDLHRKMIREAKGIPGVKKERFEEALTVKHCALSLVGEPIMYPRINELLGELHRRKISTFLVTNAQFPDAIESLSPITQLYVSVDAGTPEALKAVDRPLFTDYWERYIASMKALKAKKQRTVYRLTLVKDHNMSDAADYARLVSLGEPDFIEIKSVTFCGESKASSLNMGNVPWHEEVKQFSEAMLAEEGLADRYELACEHQHSCIVLIANTKYKIQGKWHTWINYERFNELVSSGKSFDAMDYLAETPSWAVYGSEEAGFDPEETRVYHNRTKRKAQAGLLSDAQLRHYPGDPAKA